MSRTYAAVFPGQGSQAVGMARDFHDSSAAAREVLERAEAVLPGLLDLMFEGPAGELQLTANQQPALVAAGLAAWAAWQEAGAPAPAYAAGHSLGEFTALCASGSLELEAALRLVRRRGELMQEAVEAGGGAMAAVMKLSPEQIAETLATVPGTVETANLNSPAQTVISGEEQAVGAAADALKELGGRVIPLKVSAPFHCSLMQPAADRFAPLLAETTFTAGNFPVFSNVTARPHERERVAQRLEEQVTGTVRWTETVERLSEAGVDCFIEFGSGKVLTGLAGRITKGVTAAAVTDMDGLAAALKEVN